MIQRNAVILEVVGLVGVTTRLYNPLCVHPSLDGRQISSYKADTKTICHRIDFIFILVIHKTYIQQNIESSTYVTIDVTVL